LIMKFMAMVLVVVGLLPGMAVACLNDRETKNSEREFRSRYEKPAATVPGAIAVERPIVRKPESQAVWSLGAIGAGVGGLVLIGAAVALTIRKLKQ
jgi:hypothetical protein